MSHPLATDAFSPIPSRRGTGNVSEHRVLVCGGRDYTDRRGAYTCLDGLVPRPTTIIHGGANGADALAADWAAYRQVPRVAFYADWDLYGKGAGPMRNEKMLREGKPDLVLAFPGGRGTADMVRRARAAGVRVIDVAR